jgi:DNA-directed RNA polymerase specialized sigma24 family protein
MFTSTTTYEEAVAIIREPSGCSDEALAYAIAFFTVRAGAKFLAQGLSYADYEYLVDQATESAFFAIRGGVVVEYPAAFVSRIVANQFFTNTKKVVRRQEDDWNENTMAVAEAQLWETTGVSTEDTAVASWITAQALTAICNLPRLQAVAVYLIDYEGWRVAEVARHLKCAESTVRSAHKTGLNKVRRALRAQGAV